MLLSETRLRCTESDCDVALNANNLLRMHSYSGGGDVAISTRACFTCAGLNAVTVGNCLECLALKVCVAQNNSVFVVGVYRPPTASSSAVDETAHLLAPWKDSEIVLLGDFNLK